jgi:cell division septation protein DedD
MLHTMKRRVLLSSLVTRVLPLALASVALVGCNKDKKDDGDAAADATAIVVADAAADAAVADAAVDAADAAVAPLATVVAPRPTAKPKPIDPPICAAARTAKARNSPAAPGLEKQCLAAGGTM